MYTKGADETKKWILAVQKFLKEEAENQSQPPIEDKIDPEDEEDERTPFDVLEKVRELSNIDLKDPEDDEEIEKILKDIAKEVKKYVPSDEEEEKEAQKKLDSQGKDNQQLAPNMTGTPSGVNPNGGTGDMGANMPNDQSSAAGGQLGGSFPASGGQM